MTKADSESMKKVSVNGVDLAYRVYGSGSQDLLFVHGVTGRGALYKTLFDELASHFTITALDCRAHGGSADVTKNVSVDQLSDDILAVVDALNLQQPLYAGHSMGGMLGMVSVLKEPQKFAALVAITPGPPSYNGSVNLEATEQYAGALRNKTLTIEDTRLAYEREMSDELLTAILEAAHLVDSTVYENWVRVERRKEHPIFDGLGKLEVAVLLLNGARDATVSPEELHRVAMRLPRCKEVIFTDEGHMLPIESPARTANEIISFYLNLQTGSHALGGPRT